MDTDDTGERVPRRGVRARRTAAWMLGARRGPRQQGALRDAVEGRTVVVTGASDGIGAQVARDLGEAGATVVLVARRRELLEGVAEEIRGAGGTALVHVADLADLDDVERVAADILGQVGHVDVLVNNAGRSIRRRVVDTVDRFHDVQRVMQLNYFGAVRLTLALLPAMLERGRGHVVQVSTLGTLAHPPYFSAYLASKAALEEYGRVMAHELRDRGISVSVVHLPLVRTAMIAPTEQFADMRAFSPRQGAAFVTRAIASRPVSIDLGVRAAVGVVDAVAPRMIERAWLWARGRRS